MTRIDLLSTLLICCLAGCKGLDGDFVDQCEKNQKVQKVAMKQSGLANGMTDAILTYDCKELMKLYGAGCKEQVKELDADQQKQFYASCIMSEHARAAANKMTGDILGSISKADDMAPVRKLVDLMAPKGLGLDRTQRRAFDSNLSDSPAQPMRSSIFVEDGVAWGKVLQSLDAFRDRIIDQAGRPLTEKDALGMREALQDIRRDLPLEHQDKKSSFDALIAAYPRWEGAEVVRLVNEIKDVPADEQADAGLVAESKPSDSDSTEWSEESKKEWRESCPSFKLCECMRKKLQRKYKSTAEMNAAGIPSDESRAMGIKLATECRAEQ